MNRSRRVYLGVWVLMVLVGIGGFASAIGGWLVMETTGDPGCRVAVGPAGVVVESVHRLGSSCDVHALRGVTVLAIDEVAVGPTTTPRALVDLVFQEPSTSHRWRVSRGGVVEDVDLRYEFGPLAVALEQAGDGRADVLNAAMVALGALTRTLVFGVAGVVLFQIGLRRPRALLLSGAAFAYAFGLGFENDLALPWHAVTHDLAVLACVVGISALLVSAPGVRVRSRESYVLAVGWSVATVGYLDPVLLPWSGPGEDLRLRAHLVFFVIGIAMLIHRSFGLRRAEQSHLRWIIVAMIGGAWVALPLVIPVFSQAGTELVQILVWPVTQAMLPLAVLHSLDEESDWDVQRVVQWTARAGTLVTASSLLLLLCDGLLPAVIHLGWPTAFQGLPVWALPGLGLLAALLLTALLSRSLIRLTDTVLFPGRTDTERYRAEAIGALEDCWDRADVAWCARSVARAAVGSDGGRLLVWRGDRLEALPGEAEPASPLREVALAALESDAPTSFDEPGRDDEPALVVPLSRAGERIGVLVVPCPADHLLTRRERVFLEGLAAPFAQALWQHTRAAPMRARVAR